MNEELLSFTFQYGRKIYHISIISSPFIEKELVAAISIAEARGNNGFEYFDMTDYFKVPIINGRIEKNAFIPDKVYQAINEKLLILAFA